MKREKNLYSTPETSVNILLIENSLCVSGQGTINASSEEEDNSDWTNIY